MTVIDAPRAFRFATASRFAAPVDLDWDAPVTDAICPQLPSRLEALMGPPGDVHPQHEQCLSLSVAAPRDGHRQGEGRPVMVFLHGGGFGSGSGLMSWYDGSRLAAEGDVVVVSLSYRLGPFGYLVLDGVSEGNLGLLDQLAALRWVHRYAERFGGDPANITLFGQSAGGMSINHLLEIPSARALFRRAVVQSAPIGLSNRTRAEALVDGAVFAGHLGADPHTAGPAEFLRAHRATALAHAERVGNRMDPPFVPVRGTGQIPAQPAPLADLTGLDLLVGWNHDDMTAFDADLDHAREVTAGVYADPWIERVARLRQAGARVSGYRLDWRPSGSPFGAAHCVELPLLLGTERAWRHTPMLGTEPWSGVDELGRGLRAVWTRFARTGELDTGPAAGVPVTWVREAEDFATLR